jgi:hypothetical protein
MQATLMQLPLISLLDQGNGTVGGRHLRRLRLAAPSAADDNREMLSNYGSPDLRR